MIKLDDDWLVSVGLGALPARTKNEFLAFVYSWLEGRVGEVLARRMDDSQLSEFEALTRAGDQRGALAFLHRELPDYQEVVRERFEALTEEVTAVAPQILAAEQNEEPVSS